MNTPSGRGLPGDAEQDGLAAEGFLSARRARCLRRSSPRSRGIRGRARCGWRHRRSAFPRWPCRLRLASVRELATIMPSLFLNVHFLELPDHSLAQAVAGLVFEEQDVVLGGGRCRRHDCGPRPSSCCRPATPARRRSSGPAGGRPGRASRCRAGCPADPPVRRDSGRCRRGAWRRDAGRCGRTCPSLARGCCRGGSHDPRRRVRLGRSAPFPKAETSPLRAGKFGSWFLFFVLGSSPVAVA